MLPENYFVGWNIKRPAAHGVTHRSGGMVADLLAAVTVPAALICAGAAAAVVDDVLDLAGPVGEGLPESAVRHEEVRRRIVPQQAALFIQAAHTPVLELELR